MTVWTVVADLVLPPGTVRRAFTRAALHRRWLEHLRYRLSGYEVLI